MANKVPEQKKKKPAEPLQVELKPSTAPSSKPQKAKTEGGVIRNCSCSSRFQDKRYGPGRRLFTCGPKTGLHCTVCGSRQ